MGRCSGFVFGLYALIILAVPHAVAAEGFPLGSKSIYLIDNAGNETEIGVIEFSRQGNETHYAADMHLEIFKDFFLSMKEMKCLEGKEIWCFIPYPYEHPKTVSVTDLRWLEHDLLFMYKALSAFGANLWNGIYYDLEVVDGTIRGQAKAVDLNYIAGPPDDLSEPPYGEFDIGEVEASARWLPYLEIR